MDRTFEFVWPLMLIGLVFLLYFLPSIVGRNKRNKTAIFAVNLLAGWTFVGWVIALVWALTIDSTPVAAVQAQIPMLPGSTVPCTACGNYSLSTMKFCPNCGHRHAAVFHDSSVWYRSLGPTGRVFVIIAALALSSAFVFIFLLLVLPNIANQVPPEPPPGTAFSLRAQKVIQCTPTEITLVDRNETATHLYKDDSWPDCSVFTTDKDQVLDFYLSRGAKTRFLSFERTEWWRKSL